MAKTYESAVIFGKKSKLFFFFFSWLVIKTWIFFSFTQFFLNAWFYFAMRLHHRRLLKLFFFFSMTSFWNLELFCSQYLELCNFLVICCVNMQLLWQKTKFTPFSMADFLKCKTFVYINTQLFCQKPQKLHIFNG